MASRVTDRLRGHVRANVVGYVALFVALGGTGAWAADKITSKEIAKNAVRSKHIKSGNVKRPDIGANAVNSAKVGNNSLTGADIGDGTIAGAELANGSVANPKLADGAVNTPKIGDGAVNTPKIADGAVTGAKLDANLKGQLRAGLGDETAVPGQVILDYPQLGIRIETDGDADGDDNTLVIRNTGSDALNIVSTDSGGSVNAFAGEAYTLTAPAMRVVDITIAVFPDTGGQPTTALHLNCSFPIGPTIFCVGTDVQP